MSGQHVQDVPRETGDHPEQGELLHVKGSLTWQTPCYKEYEDIRGLVVKFHEALHCVLNVEGEDANFCLAEDEGGDPREEDRFAEHLLTL